MHAQPTVTHRAETPGRLRGHLDPVAMTARLWSTRDVTLVIARREVMGRYRSATLGLLWSAITPLCALGVYTLVFSGIFKARFSPQAGEGHGHFALYLFCGMLVYGVFAEVVARAPGLVLENPNYVKKVVFPLEVLVPASMLTSLFHLGAGFAAWLAFWGVLERSLPPPTIALLPLVLLPMCLMTAGLAWTLSAVGVSSRDLSHAAPALVGLLSFLTPVYYSLDRIEQPTLRWIMGLNPLAQTIEQARRVAIEGVAPAWGGWLLSLGLSAVVCLLGYAFFMKRRRAFADVL